MYFIGMQSYSYTDWWFALVRATTIEKAVEKFTKNCVIPANQELEVYSATFE